MSQQLMHRFLSECGCWGPIQLLAQNPASGDTLRRSLEKPFAIIGRNPKADLSLVDEEVSHRHAYLQVYEGRVFCIDLKSRTGTHWDNGPQEYGWLEGKQSIRVGSYRLKLMAGSPGHPPEKGAEPLISRPVKNLALGGVSLEFMPRNGDPELDPPLDRWKMQRALALVGRSPVCKVRLVHPSVSRIHCSLVRTPLGLWVVDLLGRKGTLVNGAPVSWALLEEGDRLQIGKFLVRVHYDDSRRPESRRAKPPDTPAEIGDDETSEINPPSNIVLLSGSSPDISEAEGSRQNEDRGLRIEDGEPTEAPPVADARTPAYPGSSIPAANEDQGSWVEEGQPTEALSSIIDPRSSAPAATEAPSTDSPEMAPASPPRSVSAPEPGGRYRGGALVRSASQLPTKAELLETILPAITDQFAQMQQQMFDQFQQAMIMMFRTFGQLHREQMDMVRQELDRIHQLTQQLHELQMELAKHPAAAGDPAVQEMLAALPPVSKARIENGGSKNQESGVRSQEPDDSRSSILAPQFLSLPPDDAWESALKAMIEDGGSENQESGIRSQEPGDSRSPSLDPQFSSAEEPSPEPERPPSLSPADAPTLPSPRVGAGKGEGLGGDRGGDKPTDAQAKMTQDIHVVLCRQIAALQEERQSRWQRILSFITGKASREPMP